MKSQSNKVQSACDVKIYSDKGSLALRFPVRHSPLWEILDGKSLKGKPKCLGIGKYGFSADNPDDFKRASAIAAQMESDLDHPEWDKLFDRTLAKYGLGGGKYAKLADIIQLPGTVQALPEITVGAMWEEYLLWKQPQVQPTTFEMAYSGTFTNALKGLKWDKKTATFTDTGNSVMSLALQPEIGETVSKYATTKNKHKLLSALAEAFTRLQSQGKTKLTKNPFVVENRIENKTDKYKSTVGVDGIEREWWNIPDNESNDLESDTRAFTKVERDIIIKAFYESDRPGTVQAAPLIEFLFLTGCRLGEAFALRWQDVFMGRDKNYVRFSKSYNGKLKNTQQTKTGDTRLFKIYPNLNDLLLRIKPIDAKSTDLVFCNTVGNSYNTNAVSSMWLQATPTVYKGKKYFYPGVVTQLVEKGAISCYLSPYHTRHTFITLMAHAGTDLLLLATACGNSVEVIQRHYLGVNTEAQFPNI